MADDRDRTHPNLLQHLSNLRDMRPNLHFAIFVRARASLVTLPLPIQNELWILVSGKFDLTKAQLFLGIINPYNDHRSREYSYMEFDCIAVGTLIQFSDWYTRACSWFHFYLLNHLGRLSVILKYAVALIGEGNERFVRMFLDTILVDPTLKKMTLAPYINVNTTAVVDDPTGNTGRAAGKHPGVQEAGEKPSQAEGASDEPAEEQNRKCVKLNRDSVDPVVEGVDLAFKVKRLEHWLKKVVDDVPDSIDLNAHPPIIPAIEDAPECAVPTENDLYIENGSQVLDDNEQRRRSPSPSPNARLNGDLQDLSLLRANQPVSSSVPKKPAPRRGGGGDTAGVKKKPRRTPKANTTKKKPRQASKANNKRRAVGNLSIYRRKKASPSPAVGTLSQAGEDDQDVIIKGEV